MTLSLRGRLLIGVISLVAVGLLVSDIATYLTLQGSLLGRIDEQLTKRSTVDTARTALANYPLCQRGRGPGIGTNFSGGTFTEAILPAGTVVAACGVQGFGAPTSVAKPTFPKSLPNAGADTPAQPFTVGGTGGVSQYRMTDWPEGSFGGRFVIFAVPLTSVQSTLSQLLILEALIGAGVLAATALLAFLIISIGLRPLQKMGAVAQDIAAGDLTRRVGPSTPKTEIGRLGLALNGMLSQIKAAYGERTITENTLRTLIADASPTPSTS